MKLSALMMVLLSFTVFDSAQASSSSSVRALRCELSDAVRNRVFDWKEQALPQDANEPILFLFSWGPIKGTVRDLPGASPLQRNLEISLYYRTGMESSEVRGTGRYRTDQPLTASPLAAVRIDGPSQGATLGQLTALKCFLREAAPERALQATSLTFEFASGSAWGMCSGSDQWFCMDRLKRDAREDAIRQARFRCEMRQGKADTWSAHCSDSCFPFSIPSDAMNQSVRCTADCSIRCEIP